MYSKARRACARRTSPVLLANEKSMKMTEKLTRSSIAMLRLDSDTEIRNKSCSKPRSERTIYTYRASYYVQNFVFQRRQRTTFHAWFRSSTNSTRTKSKVRLFRSLFVNPVERWKNVRESEWFRRFSSRPKKIACKLLPLLSSSANITQTTYRALQTSKGSALFCTEDLHAKKRKVCDRKCAWLPYESARD